MFYSKANLELLFSLPSYEELRKAKFTQPTHESVMTYNNHTTIQKVETETDDWYRCKKCNVFDHSIVEVIIKCSCI